MKKSLVRSQYTSKTTSNMYRRQMTTLAENVFEFVNMPEYIDIAYINRTLVFNGAIAFFYDDIWKSVIALPFDVVGNLDIYNRPLRIMARSANGRYYRKLSNDVNEENHKVENEFGTLLHSKGDINALIERYVSTVVSSTFSEVLIALSTLLSFCTKSA